MRGNLGYFAGIDRVNHAMHNVSFRESVADADQMASFKSMLDPATEFTALGVRFQRPILNFAAMWSFGGQHRLVNDSADKIRYSGLEKIFHGIPEK